jgi:mono/diheme cytochrome c family protein
MKATMKASSLLAALGMVMLTAPIVYAGKAVFENKCGSCHATGGEAPVFAPTKYASVQWERFFERNTHARKKDISALFTPAELTRVKDYLVAHAADSDQPVAIGLR